MKVIIGAILAAMASQFVWVGPAVSVVEPQPWRIVGHGEEYTCKYSAEWGTCRQSYECQPTGSVCKTCRSGGFEDKCSSGPAHLECSTIVDEPGGCGTEREGTCENNICQDPQLTGHKCDHHVFAEEPVPCPYPPE